MLSAEWFARDAPDVARDLLGKLLVVDRDGTLVSGRIVETEAYLRDDPASHSFNGSTTRNAVMFGPPGRLYVYRSYGVHCCANVVTGADGDGQAVLLRAVEPVSGLDVIRSRRAGRLDRELANGPGKLCEALGLTLSDNGVSLSDNGVDASSPIRILDDGTPPPRDPIVGPRIGIAKAVDIPWRFRSREPVGE
ncbi:MAG TPA: DNA-3-methyladenine glycosylase [Ilumatobacteraceae bacterium]|nr:DNA-3-methyladenine glycosylase [Ilumatobacteraceae bacterium]